MDVVLMSTEGQPIGTAPKEALHGANTPLHLAFSCHLIDADGRLLLTRRALSKRSWPGVWTNSFCGHPQPGEEMADAIRRHARSELGIDIDNLQIEIPDFRYTATDASGVVENEICPVYSATTASSLDPDPTEVVEWHWITREELRVALDTVPWMFSPWLVKHFPQLDVPTATGDSR